MAYEEGYLECDVELNEVASDGVAETYENITVPTGQIYVVQFAVGYHDDAVQRTAYWGLTFPSGVQNIGSTALNPNVFNYLYSVIGAAEPIILHAGEVLRFTVNSLDAAGGKKLYIKYGVRIYKGLETYGG